MRHPLATAALVATLLAAAAPASATWHAVQDGNSWYVKNGNEAVAMPDEKTARKTAKQFNRIEKKAGKSGGGDGVWDDGSGHCDDPLFNC